MPSPTTHRVVTGADGLPMLVKRATDPATAARLAGEATVLRTLAHPGTVTVVGQTPDELHLAWVGPHSLATVTGLPAAVAGDLVAQVATTVADLHRTGIVHRRLTADHVLLGPAGRAVLTGLADATGAGADGVDPADDVAALGALLTRLVAPHDGEPVVPERRRGRSGDGGQRAALLTLADRALADDPATRPTAAELATALHALAGDGDARTARARAGTGGRGRRVAAGALASALAATVGAAIWIAPGDEAREVAVPAPTPTSVVAPSTTGPTSRAPTTTTTSTTTTTTTPPAPAQDCPPVVAPAADVDGDGCAEAVRVEGERVTVGTTTWRAGRPGDVAVVGDWDCDGRATVATLRPGTGEVFVFDRWERALTVVAVARVDGATGLRVADPDGDGCAALVADRAGAAPVTVELAP